VFGVLGGGVFGGWVLRLGCGVGVDNEKDDGSGKSLADQTGIKKGRGATKDWFSGGRGGRTKKRKPFYRGTIISASSGQTWEQRVGGRCSYWAGERPRHQRLPRRNSERTKHLHFGILKSKNRKRRGRQGLDGGYIYGKIIIDKRLRPLGKVGRKKTPIHKARSESVSHQLKGSCGRGELSYKIKRFRPEGKKE